MKICPVNATRLAVGVAALGAIFYGATQSKETYEHPPLVSWVNADDPALANPEQVPEMPREHIDFNRVHGVRCRFPEVAGTMVGGIREGEKLYKLTCDL